MLVPGNRIYIAGHRGMVGSALVRALGDHELITADRNKLDLLDQARVREFLNKRKPQIVIIAAAKVGGIHANETYPAEFLYENLMIAANLIHASYQAGVKRLLFLGSSCIYPKHAPQPMPEDCLLTGPLEPTNEAYAIAKIAGLKLCQHYRKQYGVTYHSAMPTNLYGPGDNYHPENSHVIPALLRRFHEAKGTGAESVTLWGTGTPRREFLHVDDLASACVHLLAESGDDVPDLVNVGYGKDLSIRELGELIAEVVGFRGRILQDPTFPDGTPRKLMDTTLLAGMGWTPQFPLRNGLAQAYREFKDASGCGALRAG